VELGRFFYKLGQTIQSLIWLEIDREVSLWRVAQHTALDPVQMSDPLPDQMDPPHRCFDEALVELGDKLGQTIQNLIWLIARPS
jgi:hypothetical protein